MSITYKVTVPNEVDIELAAHCDRLGVIPERLIREFVKLGLLALAGDRDPAKAVYTKEDGKEVRVTFTK